MHLPELPTVFVKAGEERKVYFTVQARELLAQGWVEKTEVPPTPVVEEKKETAKPEPKTRGAKAKVEFIEEDK